MKQLILFSGFLLTGIIFSGAVSAQKTDTHKKKTDEIIIRKDGDKNSKMTIEINGDSITINGKPLSDYHEGDVSVIERDFMNKNSHNFLYSPGNDNIEFESFLSDAKNSKPKTFLGVFMDKADEGVKITEVIKGSAAEKSGLQKSDIITKIDDKKITATDDLTTAIEAHKPGDEIKIAYLRDNKKKDTKVKLGATKKNRNTFNLDSDHGMDNNFNWNMPPMDNLQPLEKHFNFNYNFNEKPKLGVKIEDTENESGAKITNVEEGSAADKAGLKKDDVITSVNDEKVSNVNEVKDQLYEAEENATLHVKAMRYNSEMNFDIKIPKKMNSADL